jgi:aspartate beta-hydroxylase
MSDIDQIVEQANRAANAGRWLEAEGLWFKVAQRQPDHPVAFHRLGIHAFQRGAFAEAVKALERAVEFNPTDPFIRLMLANAEREKGNVVGELEVLDAALALDPYFYPALLAKGGWQERQGLRKMAAETYRNVMKIAPPIDQWPEGLKAQLRHAQSFARQQADQLYEHLKSELGSRWSTTGRWAEAVSIMAGRTKPYHSDSNQMFVPRLPAIPFFDRDEFAWAPALESQTRVITDELHAAQSARADQFEPYIAYRPGDPVNQWARLNHSNRWSTLKLWTGGVRNEDNLAACPATAKALEACDMADIDGLCPNAMFSALAPHTEIPPHHGETNARLVVHLPLIVPDKCTYRVGFEQRQWEVGKLLIFDDTLEHTARNDSDDLRVVLIFDVWNPCLSGEEREIVRTLTRAARNFA